MQTASDSKDVLFNILAVSEEETIAVPLVFAAKNGIAANYDALWGLVHFFKTPIFVLIFPRRFIRS